MTQLRGLLPNPPPLKPSVPHPEIGSQARSSLLYSCSSRIILACYVQQCKMLMFQKYPSEKCSIIESMQHNCHEDAVQARMRFGCCKRWNIFAQDDSVMMFRHDRHKLVQNAEDWQQEPKLSRFLLERTYRYGSHVDLNAYWLWCNVIYKSN